MLKSCGPIVSSTVSWSKQCPKHEITQLLVSPKLSEIVTGGQGGELVIWDLDSESKFKPKWMCYGHSGSVQNLGHARYDDKLSDSYFFSHSSTNEIAVWDWEDGTCVDWLIDREYKHLKIKSYQPGYMQDDGSRLLVCCGAYPCIVVMHALQLSKLFVLASEVGQSNWINDFTIFTHGSLGLSPMKIPSQQEVVIGVSNSGVVTVWTLTGKETLYSTVHEHESRMIQPSSAILQIHCCEAMPRSVLLVCAKEWRILDAIDCSTQALVQSEDELEFYIGGSFFKREYLAIFTNAGEALIYRLPKDLISNMGAEIPMAGAKPQLIIKLQFEEPRKLKYSFQHIPVKQVCKSNLHRLGAPENTISTFFCGRSDGRISAWNVTIDMLVEPRPQCLSILPFVSADLQSIWEEVIPALPSNEEFFNPSVSVDEVVTCAISAYPVTNETTAEPARSLPPHLIWGNAKGEIVICSSDPTKPIRRFHGHNGAVLTLIHPFSFVRDRKAFRPGLFFSGGKDLFVRMWDLLDILSEEDEHIMPLKEYTNNAGPVIAFTIGPPVRYSDPSHSICTVDACGIVNVITPNDGSEILMARTASGFFSNSPNRLIYALSWRQPQNILLLLGADGDLTMWDAHTGRMERHQRGPNVRAIFEQGTDTWVVGSNRSEACAYLPNLKPANQSAAACSVCYGVPLSRITTRNRDKGSFLSPVMLQSVGKNVQGGPAAFVYHFDIEALVYHLLSAATDSASSSANHLSLRDSGRLLCRLLSLIYPWGVESFNEQEKQVLKCLGITNRPPKRDLACLSMAGYLTLRFPDRKSTEEDTFNLPSKLLTSTTLSYVSLADAITSIPMELLPELFPVIPSRIPMHGLLLAPFRARTEPLSRLLHRLRLHTFLARWHNKCPHVRMAARMLTFCLLAGMSTNERKALVEKWINLLPQSTSTTSASSQTDLKSSGSDSNLQALECCESQDLLKLSIKLESGVFDSFAFGHPRPLNGSSVHRYRAVNCAIITLAALATFLSDDEMDPYISARDLCIELSYPPSSPAAHISPNYGPLPPEAKISPDLLNGGTLRSLVTALLSYLDFTTPPGSKTQSVMMANSPIRKTAIDLIGRGFTIWEPYLETGKVLDSLLNLIGDGIGKLSSCDGLQPGEVFSGSPREKLARNARQSLWRLAFARPHLFVLSLSYSIRCAGPYALTAMFNTLSAGYQERLMKVISQTPTIAAPIFAEDMSKQDHAESVSGNEVARGVGTSNQPPPPAVLPLLRAAPEVLTLLKELISHRSPEMACILPELVEVILVCGDRTKLRERGLYSVFPTLQRYHCVGSHTRAQKICVGGTNGHLIFFDFKNGRLCDQNAHSAPVTAVAFNPDGRNCASYCMHENTIKTWQIVTAGLFGMGSQQVKLLNTYPVRPLQSPGGAMGTPLNVSEISLAWTEPNILSIVQSDIVSRSVTLN